MVEWSAAFLLKRAAFLSGQYDRKAKGEVLYNLTDGFHLCGLIERAGSIPKSGATHRRSVDRAAIDRAKAAFCRAHSVVHPQVWEEEARPSCDHVRQALLHAYEGEQQSSNASSGSPAHTDYVKTAMPTVGSRPQR
jgi:hypothetical protein